MKKKEIFCLAFLYIFVICRADSTPSGCKERLKFLLDIDFAKEAITKAKSLLPTCAPTATNPEDGDVKEKATAFLDSAIGTLSKTQEKYPDYDGVNVIGTRRPRNCDDVLNNGNRKSGIYWIWPQNRVLRDKPIKVFCDMDTEGGGWTVIQRRGNFTYQEDFYREWKDYKTGFGDITRDFWLGNDNIFALSNQEKTTLRFDMQNLRGEVKYAEFESFWIEAEESNYAVHFGGHRGSTGDGFHDVRNRMFSTKDRDNSRPDRNCIGQKMGGWWYWDCGESNPNGLYRPYVKDDRKNVNWKPFTNYDNVHSIEMKLKHKPKK